ncbi:MAG: trypsin-like peptidase domain-containing protein [Candidatus Pacebacteria bacterium]|nr:trypsin-like peptidase domain-containing protein [Candidatus Paceibacterota bacterium]
MHSRIFLLFLVTVATAALLYPSELSRHTSLESPTPAVVAAATIATGPARTPEPAVDTTSAAAPEQSTRVTVAEPLHQTPALDLAVVNERTRAAVVNILCTATGNDLNPVSGSGVIIDGKGTVLTNAHIGQYVLLQDASPIDMECTVRTGSPAKTMWKPRLLYISETWIAKHAQDIRTVRPTGTGENDFALLALEAIDTPLSLPLPFVTPDVRDGVIVTGEQALAASYPAGFAGAVTIYNQLSLTSTVATIKRLYTFSEQTIDLLSLGGIILAQQGSSGGALVDSWGNLVGLIVTSSDAITTSERDLRALTLSHINRILTEETGVSLATHLARDPRAGAVRYRENKGLSLAAVLTAAVFAAP